MSLEATIRSELDANPGVYDLLSPQEAADYMNDPANGSRPVTSITGTQLFEATTDADKAALDATQLADYKEIVGLGEISVASGSRGKTKLVAMFNDKPTTKANIIALTTEPESPASLRGLRHVKVGHIERARAL